MSETAIICHLASTRPRPDSGRGSGRRLSKLATPSTGWTSAANYDRIRDHIEHVVPGFDDYNRRVRQPGGFYLPNPPRDKQEFPHRHRQSEFHRPSDPAITISTAGQTSAHHPPQPRPVQHHHLRRDDRYRGINGGRRVIFMNADDIKSRGSGRRPMGRPHQPLRRRHPHRSASSRSSPTKSPAVRAPCTTPNPIPWSPSSTSPTAPTNPRANPSSSR